MSLLLDLTLKVSLALSSDLLEFPSSWDKIWLSVKIFSCTSGQNCQIGKIFRNDCSKKQFKRMWPPRSQDPQTSQRNKCIQPPKTVQKECTDSDGVNYARPLKVSKAERFFIRCSYTCVLIFMPFLGFQQKANTCLWPIPSKHRQYNFQWYLTSA
jgi:hypothetical protein